MEQIILWEKEQLEEFLLSSDNEVHPEQEEVLTKIKNELELDAMEQPFEYVKSVQANFDYESIAFTDEYYDLLGIDRQ